MRSGLLLLGAVAPAGAQCGLTWQAGAPVPTPAFARLMVELPDGSVVVGGQFTQVGAVPAANVARWIAGSWLPLGAGVNSPVTALAVAANGDVFAGGAFTQAGGAPIAGIARWDGQSWSPLGVGLPPTGPAIDVARAIAIAGNGDVLVAMDQGGIQLFDGQQWSPLPLPGSIAVSHAMVTRSNGDVVIGGSFNGFGALPVGVLTYNSGTPTVVPGAPNFVTSMLRTAADAVVMTGTGVQSWNGTAWTQLPMAYIYDFAELPNGELIAVGNSTTLGGGGTSCLYRLRPTGWQTWGDITGGGARGVLVTRWNDLLVCGSFQSAGGIAAVGFAHAVPACPAATTITGLGCAGSAGPVALLPERDAWLGATFQATAIGMAANPLALQLLGTAPAALPLPLGAPGCLQLVDPVLSDVLFPAAGTATCSLFVPNLASLVGRTFLAQVVGIEFAGGTLSQTSSTNALLAT
ncbi:MAG: hypothetical protein WAT39_14985, partial [Planctomycetota bacterium]